MLLAWCVSLSCANGVWSCVRPHVIPGGASRRRAQPRDPVRAAWREAAARGRGGRIYRQQPFSMLRFPICAGRRAAAFARFPVVGKSAATAGAPLPEEAARWSRATLPPVTECARHSFHSGPSYGRPGNNYGMHTRPPQSVHAIVFTRRLPRGCQVIIAACTLSACPDTAKCARHNIHSGSSPGRPGNKYGMHTLRSPRYGEVYMP